MSFNFCFKGDLDIHTLDNVGAGGQVPRALDSRSEGLGFDSQCWSCVEVSGKLRIPYCLDTRLEH